MREELKNVLRFWKGKGVKGFRFDVVNLISKPALLEDDHQGDGRRFYTDGPHVHEYLHELVTDAGIEDYVTVGEMSSTSLDNCVRYTNPASRELNMVFNFHHLKVDYKNGDKWTLMPPDLAQLKNLFRTWQEGMQAENGWNAVFWCNHDQPRVVSRFGNDERYREESAKMLATCIHLMRGTPYIYQGEELGMTNAHYTAIDRYRDVESLNYYKILLERGRTEAEAMEVLAQRSRDNARTPMQWSAAENAGFTTGMPWILPPENYKIINAEAALADESSVFYFYQRLIRLRKEHPVIAQGEIAFLYPEEPKVVAYRRFDENEELLVLCSFTEEAVALELPEQFRGQRDVLLGNYSDMVRHGASVCLRPYECLVFKR